MAISVGIVGASGYTGSELLRYLAQHPSFKPQVVTADTQAGKYVRELFPHLVTYGDMQLASLAEAQERLAWCDLVFIALPHGEAMKVAPSLKNPVVIDLGGDFRLRDKSLYESWYRTGHTAEHDLPHWIYGLPELFRTEIVGAKRIANPGCYATAAILSAAPLVKAGIIEGALSCIGMSGHSGAGKVPKESSHFPHAHENIQAYKVATHQHTPEIEQALSRYASREVQVSFVPHLVPLSRGIFMTTTAALSRSITSEELFDIFTAHYHAAPLVSVERREIGTKEVRGSASVRITPYLDIRTQQVIITTVIDNLGKGAAAQAIQNANIALGHEECAGLILDGVYP